MTSLFKILFCALDSFDLGLFAVQTSLSIASAMRAIDRRALLLGLTLLMLASGLTVARRGRRPR